MGVKHLFKTIAEYSPTASTSKTLSELTGKTVVIDLSLYLHRFHATQGHSFTGLYHQINALRDNGIVPIYVFDGKYPEAKTKTIQERKEILLQKKAKLRDLEKQENASKEELFKAKNLSFRIDEKELQFCKKLFDLLGVPWLQAKGEADILMATMVKQGKADAAMTEDGDLFAFGCPVIWRKFGKGSVEVIQLDKVLQGMSIDLNIFQQFCVLSGCDYLNTLKGIGPKTALKLLKESGSIAEILKAKKIDAQTYDWKSAHKIFKTDEKTRRTKFELSPPDTAKLLQYLKKHSDLSEKRLKNIELRLTKLLI